ncbi:SUMF1/EgtB/PvdO family nonheme iron enzyme [Rhodopirellula europaea]|nr:SUMF1/EgtB/PvdO family nonheme iron enzyme [Rhodopirellula europaea]
MLLPAGSFRMGDPSGKGDEDERPVHQVELGSTYYMGAFEVTQRQYEQLMERNPSQWKGKDQPVDNVSWRDATAFCNLLSRLPEEKTAGRVYRLPTEAEWEYACRAGTQTHFNCGDDPKAFAKAAWFKQNSQNQTHPVGTKAPNAWGLHDMHGNVWEWCQDWYGNYSDSRMKNPQGPSSGSKRVLRGGAFGSSPVVCRSESRHRFPPEAATDFIGIGFRVVIDSASSSNTNDRIEKLLERAEKGDVRAQFDLGLLYEEGEFVPQSTSTAVAWYRKAEEQGLVAAKYKLGVHAMWDPPNPQTFADGIKWIQEAAKQGDPDAQQRVAMWHYTGLNVPSDHGKSVLKDLELAKAWSMKAAKQGNVSAMGTLGLMHFYGEGGPKDYVTAYAWLTPPSVAGNQDSMELREKVKGFLTPDELLAAEKLGHEFTRQFKQ